MHTTSTAQRGFTLIELSIVLVVIGLIVGGVLVGQDLIRAAAVRGTISQIEKYNTAVNTFRDKYGGLPGDLNASSAAQFGFVARAGTPGRGDGNGVIEGNSYGGPIGNNGVAGWIASGEPFFFWEDLSQAGLIEGTYNTFSDAGLGGSWIPAASVPLYLPVAKTGSAYVYVFSANGVNYFGVTGIGGISSGAIDYDGQYQGGTDSGLSVSAAYSIDVKVDDGIANTGKMQVWYPDASGSLQDIVYGPSSYSLASWACFVGATGQYATANGDAMNCGLSFQFQ
jgi:prepilin-type N-terminal cleavage/methylation domain-containing protein